MLNDNCTNNEVLREQHEDILLKLNDGKFAGIQVKTREADLGALTIKEESIFNFSSSTFPGSSSFPDSTVFPFFKPCFSHIPKYPFFRNFPLLE